MDFSPGGAHNVKVLARSEVSGLWAEPGLNMSCLDRHLDRCARASLAPSQWSEILRAQRIITPCGIVMPHSGGRLNSRVCRKTTFCRGS